MADILTTTRATKPGAYIGRIFRPAPTGVGAFARLPCLVGKGSRLQTVFNAPIRRSYRNNIGLDFTLVTPHIATLAYPAVDDQIISRLYKSDGSGVSPAFWSFQESNPGVSGFDQVVVTPDVFDANADYFIDYQSTSESIKDELPFTDLREIRLVGDGENQSKYVENTDYYIPITMSSIVPDIGNVNDIVTQSVTATGVSIGGAAPAMTLTVSAATFAASDVGKTIVLSGATTSANSGSFVITSFTSSTVVGYSNSAGVAEAYTQPVTLVTAYSPIVRTGSGTSLVSLQGSYLGSYNRTYSLVLAAPSGGYITGTVGITLNSAGNTVTAPSPYHSTEAAPTNGISVGVSIAGTAPTMTLTTVSSIFSALDVGKSLVISNATTEANNGIFTIASYISGTSVTYTNASGVAEAFTETATVVRGQTVKFKENSFSTSAITDPGVSGSLITLRLDDTGALVTSANDTFTFTGLGPSLIEPDLTVTSNTNKFPEFTAVVPVVTNASATLTVREDSAYSSVANRKYLIKCTVASGVSPSRTATFKWVGYGDGTAAQAISTEGTFSISEVSSSNLNVTLENGIKLDLAFGTVHFTVGDSFTFGALAPRKFITAKDSRDYTLTVSAVAAASATVFYSTNTVEGRFGTVVVTGNKGSLRLPGGVDLFLRNIGSTLPQNRYAATDEYTFSTVNSDLVDWSLRNRKLETISTTEIYEDALGTVTDQGVGTSYIVLEHVPTDVLYVKDTVTSTLLTATNIVGQPIIWFPSAPANSVSVYYEYKGAEPSPGGLYFVTANIKRPAELYNTPLFSQTFDEASRLLGPISTTNDLLIAAELALVDNGAPGIYTCQAMDSDNDGIISSVDINNAIIATERNAKLTDVIVLNGNSSLSTAATSNERMNDPFERKERALWWGMPVGSAIGNTTTSGTITFTAKKSLQVYGDNPAHGTRVLVANNRAVKTITLTDGTQTDITLDGGFIQAAIASKNASFADPGTALVRQFISGFKSMNTYSESEELQLEAASVLYLSNQGSTDSPIFRIEESVTVDQSSPDNAEISVAINQKQYVTRAVRESMDTNLVGVVPPSEQAGLSIVRTYLSQLLLDLVTKGIIGPYTDENGNTRALDVNQDIEIFRNNSDKTLYNFKYWWNARYPVKRLFGLYSVDRKLFTQS